MDIQFPAHLQTKLSRLAKEQGRNAPGLVVEAVERMIDYDDWFLAEVEKGLTQIESGQTLTHEEARCRLEKYLAAKQQAV